MVELASQWAASAVSADSAPFIAADVGGTHARIGLVRGGRGSADGRVTVLEYHKYVCAEYDGLDAILRDFLDGLSGTPVHRCALACAGYPIDGVVINDNLPWRVSVPQIRDGLGLADLSLINDFEAVAYATRFIDAENTLLLSTCGQAPEDGPVVVVGPGTGLGSAVFIPERPRPRVLATEAGQINLAPVTGLERDVLELLAEGDDYVAYEHVLSGPGLLTLYRALCRLDGVEPRHASPAEVTGAALQGGDGPAERTLETFCALLGSFVGNLAMLYGARGGVYLAGGILPKIRPFLQRSAFIERFLAKGRMRAFLERVPVRLMEHGQLGVIGAAGWYLNRQGEA